MDKEAASEFKSYLLYIVPSDCNSQQALALVQQSHELQQDVWVQDVRLLNPPLPPWLNGVPIIVKRKTGEVFKGTACLDFVRDCSDRTPKYLARGSGGVQSFHSGETVGTRFEAAGVTSAVDASQRDGKLTEQSVSDFMATREEQDNRFSGNKPQDLVSTQS
jgi:hypothetical protein